MVHNPMIVPLLSYDWWIIYHKPPGEITRQVDRFLAKGLRRARRVAKRGKRLDHLGANGQIGAGMSNPGMK